MTVDSSAVVSKSYWPPSESSVSSPKVCCVCMVTAVVNEMKDLHEEHSRRENVCTHIKRIFMGWIRVQICIRHIRPDCRVCQRRTRDILKKQF